MQGDAVRGVPHTENISWSTPEKKFIVSKKINGDQRFLGSHPSLICALMIKDWCKAHNWEKYPKSKNKTGEHHIRQVNKDGSYSVYKIIDGKHVTFGSYSSLEKAIERRNECVLNEWSLDLIPTDPMRFISIVLLKNGQIKYNIHRKEGNTSYNYGLFDVLHKAMKERDLLEEHNWDYDVVCESVDERENGLVIFNNRVMI